MHRFVHPQTFDVGPVEDGEALVGHLFGAYDGFHLDVLSPWLRLDLVDECREWESIPGDDH